MEWHQPVRVSMECTMKISLGTDHAGFAHKEALKQHLEKAGHEVLDFGTNSVEDVDYPDFIRPAAEAVANGDSDQGVVFGGSGNGEAITANKVHGIRCALCWNVETGRLALQHNNANVLALPARFIDIEGAKSSVKTFLKTEFEGGRHQRRVEKIDL